MTNRLKIVTAAMGLAVALAGATGASANTGWQGHHPRRTEVNARLEHQARRTTIERRDGRITVGEARHIRAQDRHIRDQERLYASRDHGHITRGEQRRLNREENHVNQELRG